MEQDHEKQHVCKLCNKKFSSGRILGGHMRNHLAKNSGKAKVKIETSDIGIEGYGLRENPKKSWKSSKLNHNCSVQFQENVKCQICGKKFKSARSLHGHLRHHSVEERSGACCRECGKGFRSLRSLTGHMRLHSEKQKVCGESRPNLIPMILSDAETVSLVRRKRSNRMRYKATPNSSFSSLNESVSGFEIEQEVEDVAMCLMMLSRGVCEWSESLDNDSVSFEAKSLHPNEKSREEILIPCASDSKSKISEFSDCDGDVGCNKEKKIGLDIPIENLYCRVDSKRLKLEDESGLLLYDTEMEKGIHDNESEASRNFAEVGFDLTGRGYLESIPNSNAAIDACDTEMKKISYSEIMCSTSDFDILDDPKKKSQFQCRTCKKIFPTHQALGGHQTFHRTTKSSVTLKIEPSLENTYTSILPEKNDVTSKPIKFEYKKDAVEEEFNGASNVTSSESNKSKEHKCHICLKYFVSGQALGGHKRVHIAKGKEEQNIAVKGEDPNISDALDINIPDVLIDSEANQEAGFTSWWAGGSYKHEPPVGVIAN